VGTQVNQLIETRYASLGETLKVLAALSEVELDALSEHLCAMGGTVRDLLTHNIDHERMHVGLPDDALDMRTPDDQWTIREMIEHTLYWERHSIDDLARTRLRGRVSLNGKHLRIPIKEPIYGPLAEPPE
jgi:hypothetical protein